MMGCSLNKEVLMTILSCVHISVLMQARHQMYFNSFTERHYLMKNRIQQQLRHFLTVKKLYNILFAACRNIKASIFGVRRNNGPGEEQSEMTAANVQTLRLNCSVALFVILTGSVCKASTAIILVRLHLHQHLGLLLLPRPHSSAAGIYS